MATTPKKPALPTPTTLLRPAKIETPPPATTTLPTAPKKSIKNNCPLSKIIGIVIGLLTITIVVLIIVLARSCSNSGDEVSAQKQISDMQTRIIRLQNKLKEDTSQSVRPAPVASMPVANKVATISSTQLRPIIKSKTLSDLDATIAEEKRCQVRDRIKQIRSDIMDAETDLALLNNSVNHSVIPMTPDMKICLRQQSRKKAEKLVDMRRELTELTN